MSFVAGLPASSDIAMGVNPRKVPEHVSNLPDADQEILCEAWAAIMVSPQPG